VKAVKQVIGATNLEWADVTKDNNGNLYIADVGNPRNHRKNLQVYKLPSPSNVDNERISPEKIEFSISDQEKFPPDERHLNFDLQSIVHFNDSLFLFTKNRTDPFDGIIKMYRISAAPGNHIAELRDSIFLGNDIPAQFQITSAAISPNQKNLVLLTHNKIWLFTNFKRSDFLKGKIILINLPLFSEKVAIAFKSDTEVYITDLAFRQIKEGGLYKIDLAHWLN
jgi:hypothetical protein